MDQLQDELSMGRKDGAQKGWEAGRGGSGADLPPLKEFSGEAGR